MLSKNVEIIAHRNVRINIVDKKQPGPGRLTFSEEFEIHLGGKLSKARHFGRAHPTATP